MAAYTTIDDPSVYFQIKLYAGDASATAHTLDGDTDLQPDLAWFKCRTRTENHRLVDSVRVTNSLKPNTNGAEVDSSGDGFTSLNSDGFTLNGDGGGGEFNASSGTYVVWCWKANGAGSANSDGNTTTTKTSANTTSGFSIITYDGDGAAATLGHGLSAVPHLIIQKNIDDTENWQIYHHKNTSAPETDYFTFTTNGTGDQASRWNDTAPTSTLITIGSDSSVSGSGESMVIYAWSEKQGFSKFGGYTGNGNADGAFVYTGFRPAFIIAKRGDADGYDWTMMDSKRSPFNEADDWLYPNMTSAEDTNGAVDFLSNGFKVRQTHSYWNTSGASYVYIAFAEAPFVNSSGVPCNAR